MPRTNRRASRKSSNRGPRVPRGCRAYQQRTLDVLSRSVASWKAIFSKELAPFVWGGGTCPEMARAVKKFLSSVVSPVEEEQMSFQSVKKLLPDSCRCMESVLLDDLVDRLGKEPRVLPSGYLSFVKKEASYLFPKGWDSSYEGYCLSTAPPLTSCCEASRREGGALSVLSGGQAEYLDCVFGNSAFEARPVRGELLVVQSAGKPRPLTKFAAESLRLKPLHKTIYAAISKRKWLLRGPPSKEALQRAGFNPQGGDLVSGDYASATDNLPIEVMEAVLEVALANACFVPRDIAELALRSCRPILRRKGSDEDIQIKVGQMMGSLLSFPLLCVQNYLAFRWSLRSAGVKAKVPVLINGDDILFQRSGHFHKWREVVGAVGLEVEVTKTSVSPSFGSLNSTLLRFVDGFLQPVWTARFGMFRPADHPASLGASFHSFLKDAPTEFRFNAGRQWFEWHIGELRSAGVSLPSLGFRGLLSKRLASLYHLLHLPSAEVPPYFARHGVEMCGDFVSRIETSALSEEELRFGSMEVSAQKWSIGWVPASRDRSAISYCLARSACKGDRFDYPADFSAFWVEDVELRFRVRNVVRRGATRRQVTKEFLSPFVRDDITLFPTALLESLVPDLGRGHLPPYEALPGVVDAGELRCG